MPMLKVERLLLRFLQDFKLFCTLFGTEFSGLQILSTQQRIGVLELGTSETASHRHAKELIGIWIDKIIEWTPRPLVWLAGRTTECQQLLPPMPQTHPHQGKHEIVLVQALPLTVDAHKDLSHLFFINGGRELEGSERETVQTE